MTKNLLIPCLLCFPRSPRFRQKRNIETIQKRMLEASKDYTHEEDDFEILTELQHYGGHTNKDKNSKRYFLKTAH